MSTVRSVAVEDLADSVVTRDDLVGFIREMLRDLHDNADEWENRSLGDYLEAMAAWIEDCDGYYMHTNQPVPRTPSWKTIADILVAARIYE